MVHSIKIKYKTYLEQWTIGIDWESGKFVLSARVYDDKLHDYFNWFLNRIFTVLKCLHLYFLQRLMNTDMCVIQ